MEEIDGLWFKKVQQRDITRMCQEVPWEPIVIKFCSKSNDTHVIMCAKFGGNRFTDYLLMVFKNACFISKPWW